MKKILTASLILLTGSVAQGQQKEGRVLYERTTQMQINFSGGNDEMQRMIPRSRTDKFELSFSSNLSLWKAAPQDNEDETLYGPVSDGGGIQIRMMVQGANDVLFNNFDKGTRTEQREMMDKKFIIDDSIKPLKWKMTGETKSVLNHNCMKATATQITQRMVMGMDNGEMKRNEISDTSSIIAWIASDIPVSAGPAEYQGQLPGLILEMDINNGRQTYKALNISSKVDLDSIKEPTGKKHYTPDEFKKERMKMMDEMQRNAGPGTRVIRFN
jgi:GLPGLI family protein